MSQYLGDFATGSTIRGAFNTRKSDGTPITLAGTPALSVYKDGNTTETTTGVTLTVDFDSRTGHHLFAIDTSDAFYSSGSDFRVVITTGTVDSISVIGVQVCSFSLLNRLTSNSIADAVWDEPYNQHTTAGSFGKLMDLLRKSNMVLEATVQASPAPTATTFNVTGLNYPTGAFEHAVLFFADDATLAEQNSPILTFTNNGNGTQTIVLEEARTAAPVAGDKVLIDATSHVHAIADIQSGLALQTTSLAIKAKTDLITAGQVTYTSPVGGTGKISIPIIIGDDYLAANARAFEWTITARTGVVVGTASCRFGGTNEELNKSWLVTGTVSDIGGGQWKLSFDLTKTVTGALAEGYYRWSVELLSAGGTEITEVFSGRNVEVRNKQT